ncbi:MAG: ABC transporter ATP-binding protein [Opitutales bacterium]
MIDPDKRYRSILTWAFALVASEKTGTLFGFLRGLVMMPVPVLVRWIVDDALAGAPSQRILGTTLIALGLILMHYAFAVYGAKRIAARLENIIADFRSYIFNRIQYISFGYLDTAATGKLVSKYSFDTQRVHDSLLLIANQIVPNLIYSVGVLLVLVFMNWQLAFVTILLLPIFFVARRSYFSIYEKSNNLARVAQENLTGKAGELIHSIRMVRSLGQDEAARGNVRGPNDHAAITRFQVIKVGAHFGTFMFVSGQFVTLIVLAFGAWQVLEGHMTAGTLIAFVAAMPQILMPVGIASQLMEQLIHGNESYRSVRELIDTKLVESWKGTTRPPVIRGEIELRDITFNYPSKPETDVLEAFNLHIRPGENVALVGQSGSGKSTLTYLILGLYEARKGTISIDGHPLDKLDVRWFRQQCAIVMQDNVLLSGSILENLRFAKANASEAEIREAARMANADEFIQKLSDGYETLVGERGAMLSGGQRQRISIARAILRNPTVLILDEATSALDQHSEKLIQEALARVAEGRTVITIAHRLDTIRKADRIIVMHDGRIVDEGDYATLAAGSPHFQQLLERDPERMAQE